MPAAVPMSVADVRRPTERPERHIVVLEEVGGERRLPIWIGTPEALSLVAALEEVELPRPGPYHFAQALLQAAGGALREVRVSRLADSVFYATAVLADGSEVDARPSDALTLALVTGAPIAVEAAVLERPRASRRSAPSWPPRSRGPPTAPGSSPARCASGWPSWRASWPSHDPRTHRTRVSARRVASARRSQPGPSRPRRPRRRSPPWAGTAAWRAGRRR